MNVIVLIVINISGSLLSLVIKGKKRFIGPHWVQWQSLWKLPDFQKLETSFDISHLRHSLHQIVDIININSAHCKSNDIPLFR